MFSAFLVVVFIYICGIYDVCLVYIYAYTYIILSHLFPLPLLGTDESGGASGGGSGSGSGVVTTLVTKNIVLKDGTYASVTSAEVSGGGESNYRL